MVTVFTSLFALIVNAGTGSGLVQKKEISQIDLSTVFFYNIGIGLLAMISLYCLAKPLSGFYEEPRLIRIIQVLSINPLIQSLSIVPMEIMNREIRIKERAIAQMIGQLGAAGLGVFLALSGYGVWALVFASIGSSSISMTLYWVQGKWIPSMAFSRASFKAIWSFSGKIFYSNMVDQIVQKVDTIIVVKLVNPTTLGFYEKGKNLGQLPAKQITSILTRSFFPIMSRLQTKPSEFVDFFQKNNRLISFCSISFYSALFILSDLLILCLYGYKWEGTIVFFQYAILIGMFYSLNAYRIYALNALGFPRLTLKRNIIFSAIKICAFSIVLTVGKTMFKAEWLLILLLIIVVLNFVWLSLDLRRIINVPIRDQWKSVYGYAILNALPLVLVWGLKYYTDFSNWVSLGLGGVVYFLALIVLLHVTKDEIWSGVKRKIRAQKFGYR